MSQQSTVELPRTEWVQPKGPHRILRRTEYHLEFLIASQLPDGELRFVGESHAFRDRAAATAAASDGIIGHTVHEVMLREYDLAVAAGHSYVPQMVSGEYDPYSDLIVGINIGYFSAFEGYYHSATFCRPAENA